MNNSLSNYTITSFLNTLLAGKVDDSQVLTNVPANAVFTDTLYIHPFSHSISMITGLQTALDAKAETTALTTVANKVTDMVDGLSGISLGTGTGASQRIACYEISSNNNYSWFWIN